MIGNWCGRRDLNPHILRYWYLKPARLPIPPRPLPTILPYRLSPAKQGSALIGARRKGQAARPAEQGGGTERRGRTFPQDMIEDQAMQNQRHGSDDYERARVPPATPPVIDRNADPEDAALRAM